MKEFEWLAPSMKCICLSAEDYRGLNKLLHEMDKAEREGFVCVTTPEVERIFLTGGIHGRHRALKALSGTFKKVLCSQGVWRAVLICTGKMCHLELLQSLAAKLC